jgi:hypothetical protein
VINLTKSPLRQFLSLLCGFVLLPFVRGSQTSRHDRMTSIFAVKVWDAQDRVKQDWQFSPNLRTNAGINWQADCMGNGTQPASARYIALTEDATTSVVGDTTLASELAVEGLSRALGTYAHTSNATSYTISFTFTKTGATARTINRYALFNAASVGTMPFESAMPSPPVLTASDTLAVTVTVNI